MKIAILISALNNGGSSYQAINLAKELKEKGHHITIYTLNNSLGEINANILSGITIKSTLYESEMQKGNNQILGFYTYVKDLQRRVFTLKRLLDSDPVQPDIINAHDFPTNIVAAIIRITKKIPNVFICNDVWFISGQEPTPERRIVFRLGNAYIISILDRVFSHWINTVIVLDKRIKQIVDKHYHENALVIRSGIDIDFFTHHPAKHIAREKLGLYKKTFIFLCMSIFLPHRRFEDAIIAFNKIHENYPDIQLLIVGSDAYNKDYAQKIANSVEKNKSIMVLRKYLTEEEKLLYLCAADVFVYPNENQTWGITVTEAMAVGIPCIVSKGAGVHEIITNNKTGILFSPRDTDTLSQKMRILLEDKNFGKKIGIQAKEFIKKNLSWKIFAHNIERQYIKIL